MRWLGKILKIVFSPAKKMRSKRTFRLLLFFSFLLGGATVAFAFLLLRPKQGEITPPVLSFDFVVDTSGNVDKPSQPEGTGRSGGIRVEYKVPRFHFFPNWSISNMRYDGSGKLEFVAVRLVKDKDSAHVEVRQETHYAPGGFDLEVAGDNITVDTFPMRGLTRPQIIPSKRKILRLSSLAELDTQDGLGIGVEVSAWRMIRLQALVGAGRVWHELATQKFPANQLAPWVRLRLQIALP